MTTSARLLRTLAGFCIAAMVLLSLLLSLMLPHELTERALAGGEVVTLELPLHRQQPGTAPHRFYYEYRFEVNGVTYRGTDALSEDAVRIDPATGDAWARVVYVRDQPARHRMEPVFEGGGIRWVALFPKLLTLAILLGLLAWGIASAEHLGHLLSGMPGTQRTLAHEAGLVLLNAVTVPILLLLPALALSALIGLLYAHSIYAPLILELSLGTLLAILALLAAARIGARLEHPERFPRSRPP